MKQLKNESSEPAPVELSELMDLRPEHFDAIRYIERNAVILTQYHKWNNPDFYTTKKSGYIRYFIISDHSVSAIYRGGNYPPEKDGIIIGPPKNHAFDGGCGTIRVQYDLREKKLIVVENQASEIIPFEFHGICNGVA